jgi:hypothetical protein
VADQQVRPGTPDRRPGQYFAQQRWRELAASAAAVRELRQPNRGRFHRLVHDLP